MNRLISNAEAAQRLATSASGLYRLRALKHFPKPIRLAGPRSKPLWDAGELDAFVSRQREQGT